ncbi:MAG: hypothetical protein PHF63_07530 [Herbinix sp.]|nr:hypothetical protein [Herbinix sp.]
MKARWNYIRFGVGLSIILFMIFILPYMYFLLQDRKFINIVKQMKITPVTVSGVGDIDMKLSDKLDLIGADDKDVEQVDLKMGEIFSLYEARKQCVKELCKIPVLEMDIYGPIRDEINITPKLFIDTRTPSYSMIAWTGTVTIKDITYWVALDERSKKLISIQVTEGNEELKKGIQKQLANEWKEYIQFF